MPGLWLTKFILGAGVALSAVAPANAQQWELRPAPASWGLPARPAPAAAPPPVQSEQAAQPAQAIAQAMPPSGAGSLSFDQALECAAALQLTTLASPRWSQEPGVAEATNRWLEQVFSLAPGAGVPGDAVRQRVEAEMNRQASAAASDPAALSRRAFDCATFR
jgi:hypothetical protein